MEYKTVGNLKIPQNLSPEKQAIVDEIASRYAAHLYGYLENILGSRKAATEYLQQRGIKGISYNGGIDGEARVIFNPDDIDIVRKYYNQPNLKDIYNKFINSGTFAGAITNP